jgi:hypothetical protein
VFLGQEGRIEALPGDAEGRIFEWPDAIPVAETDVLVFLPDLPSLVGLEPHLS